MPGRISRTVWFGWISPASLLEDGGFEFVSQDSIDLYASAGMVCSLFRFVTRET
jgi:hypothetical protein